MSDSFDEPITPVPKPEVLRSEAFRDFVKGLPCMICLLPGDAHHVKHKRGYGDANNLVPLCRTHHREVHTIGVETFERRRGVKLEGVARILFEAWKRAA